MTLTKRQLEILRNIADGRSAYSYFSDVNGDMELRRYELRQLYEHGLLTHQKHRSARWISKPVVTTSARQLLATMER